MDLNKLFQFISPGGVSENIQVNFFNNEEWFINEIGGCDVVLGCVPWITNREIIKKLTSKKGVCIVTDKNAMSKYISRRLALFNDIPTFKFDVSMLPCNNSYFDGRELQGTNTSAIRVFGKPEKDFTPMLHYKFFVMCDKDENEDILVKSVITGSFNLSDNATNSREVLIKISDKHVVQCFYHEWAKAFILSENINEYSNTELNPEFLLESSADELVAVIDKENAWADWESTIARGLNALYD
ncbi:phospholipase D-like domain-containing protein [Vibrio parahaemolyticus]|uniref:phospholipase D-like domain-containing protein n=1 Tax=Vibrio parahaemolyticus TaxID=670 RepID=UPI002879979F|nr:phospholipase D-like domain-containing protein [Vibrio parahaemolyticus]MDS1911679.1 phospholipase D-like domain-containing protein [Vibrio parahaemolyticus]